MEFCTDAYLNPTQQTYGNGVVANLAFDPGMGRLQTIQTGTGSSTNVQNLSYAWDPAGNLLSRADANNSVSETFTYDKVNRVLSSTIGSSVLNTRYDATGNLTSKSGVGTYTYPMPGSPQPHAVTSVSGTVNSGTGLVSTPSYSYDADGNMISGGGRVLSYTPFNVPNCIASGLSVCAAGGASTEILSYDSEHRRFQLVAPEGTTTYLNMGGVLREKFVTSGGAVTWRSYVTARGQAVGIYVQPVGGDGGDDLFPHRPSGLDLGADQQRRHARRAGCL